MRKTLHLSLFATLLVAAPFGVIAQPVFQLLGELNVGGISNQPTDFHYHDGDLYIASFGGNRNIARVNDVLTIEPTLSTVAFTADPTSGGADAVTANGPFVYEAGRGLTSIEVHPDGRILVAGDAGNPGAGFSGQVVAEYTLGGALIQRMEVPDPFPRFDGDPSPLAVNRINAATYFGSDSILLGKIQGVAYQMDLDMTVLQDPFQVGGWPNFTRGLAFVGNDIFIRTTSNGVDKIQRLTGGTIGSLTGYEWEGLQFAELGPQTFSTSEGIKSFNYQGANPMNYLVAIHVGNVSAVPPVSPLVLFYDPSATLEDYPVAPLITLNSSTFGPGGLLAVAFATTPEGQYMFLSRPAGAFPNTVQIWGIDGAQLIEPAVGELGDINGDGVINVADVTELANLIVANTLPPLEVGDINNDGEIDAADVAALAELVVD